MHHPHAAESTGGSGSVSRAPQGDHRTRKVPEEEGARVAGEPSGPMQPFGHPPNIPEAGIGKFLARYPPGQRQTAEECQRYHNHQDRDAYTQRPARVGSHLSNDEAAEGVTAGPSETDSGDSLRPE